MVTCIRRADAFILIDFFFRELAGGLSVIELSSNILIELFGMLSPCVFPTQ